MSATSTTPARGVQLIDRSQWRAIVAVAVVAALALAVALAWAVAYVEGRS